jgi:DNA-binding NtrC family response regulator
MKTSKVVMVIHPSSTMRNLLRSVLQDHQRRVVTGDSWLDLIADRTAAAPAVILLDRTLLNPQKADVLSLLHQRWTDSEIVLLPEGDWSTRAPGPTR